MEEEKGRAKEAREKKMQEENAQQQGTSFASYALAANLALTQKLTTTEGRYKDVEKKLGEDLAKLNGTLP